MRPPPASTIATPPPKAADPLASAAESWEAGAQGSPEVIILDTPPSKVPALHLKEEPVEEEAGAAAALPPGDNFTTPTASPDPSTPPLQPSLSSSAAHPRNAEEEREREMQEKKARWMAELDSRGKAAIAEREAAAAAAIEEEAAAIEREKAAALAQVQAAEKKAGARMGARKKKSRAAKDHKGPGFYTEPQTPPPHGDEAKD